MKIRILILLLLISTQIFAQSFLLHKKGSRTILFPDYKLLAPNFSDPLEAKISTQFLLNGEDKIDLYIGLSRDLIHYVLNPRIVFAIGTEFFNWTLMDRKRNFKFPVNAVDYFFGIYFVNYQRFRNFDWSNRLRVSHISAHLSDGMYDNLTNQWKNNQEPFTYSREFVQWTTSILYRNVKLYFDTQFLFHSIPEWRYKTIFGTGSEVIILGIPLLRSKIFTGFDVKFQKIHSDKFETNKLFSAGLIIGNEFTTHFRLAYQYYNGYSNHGQFFSNKLNQSIINLSLVI